MKIKRAVVLLNMGGPSNLFEVELFLKNMFADPHILQIKSNFLRKIIGSFIVNKRIEQSKKNLQAIGGKSPITPITFSLTQKLTQQDNQTFYTYVMRYTPPFADMVISELREKEIEEVILFSMYPQYSTTTTKSSITDFQQSAERQNYHPKIKIINSYYDHPLFIECITNQIKRTLDSKNPQDFTLLLSAHGLPQSIIDTGDPYEKHCQASLKALKFHLEQHHLYFKDIILCYQSKLGPMKWLEPSTQAMIKKFKNQKVIIYPLAFSIDNSETLFELDIELREEALKIGVEELLICPCPNDGEDFMKLILNLTQGEKEC